MNQRPSTNDDTDNAATVRETVPSAGVSASSPLLFNRYQTVRELGRGGMGVVLLAHDTVLDVAVALKFIPDTVLHDTEGIVDLKKEVLRGMELTHPNIVRVFSFEQDATAAAIVMEYVEGETLAQKKLQRSARCFECDEVLPWLEQLCAALDYAHSEARIAHRDLKPGNLMLTSGGRLKIADFGIASSLSDTMSRVSIRADSSGTPPYMSPQQAMGERPTHLDDIYSLGATIYELLTSKPPFFRGNILAQVMDEIPVAMAERRRDLDVESTTIIPQAWERIIAACLSKDPAGRPTNGAAILDGLKHPSRALAVANPIVLDDLRLDAAPNHEPVQRIYPRPIPASPAISPADQLMRRVTPALSLQPLATACAAVVTGAFSAVGAFIKPLLKLVIAILILWAIIYFKERWDAAADRRAADLAAAKRERGAAAAAATESERSGFARAPAARPAPVAPAMPGPLGPRAGEGPHPFSQPMRRPPPPPPPPPPNR